jgi:FkbM family methyltransferase
VFRQIFIEREYAFLDHAGDADFLIDCGANVGYSSAYLLTRFPRAELVAVEPEPGNYALLRENLRPYGHQVRMLQAGVWSHPALLTISDAVYRDGRDWTAQVRLAKPGDESLPAVDIATLLEQSGHARISILKIDIEGAEAVVFADNIEWLDSVDRIMIELHDDSVFGSATNVFNEALAGRGFTTVRHGELTVATRDNAETPRGTAAPPQGTGHG